MLPVKRFFFFFTERALKTILASSVYFRDVFQQNDWYVKFETHVHDLFFRYFLI